MKYTWSTNANDLVWENGLFDTVEDALADAKDNLGPCYDMWTVYVAEAFEYDFKELNMDLLDSILERVEDNVCEEFGEVSEDWNISSTCGKYSDRLEAYNEANRKLNELIVDYVEKIGETPHYFKVGKIVKQTTLSYNES